jgi:hypothetical protein
MSSMNEGEPIRITSEDVDEANRLSLGCPICASAVEDNVTTQALTPVVCAKCQTLYHRTCWEQNGGKCATLGCGHTESYPYGTEIGPRLRIRYSDLPKHAPQAPTSPNGRFKELKEQQKRLQDQAKGREFWKGLYSRILRAFGWR